MAQSIFQQIGNDVRRLPLLHDTTSSYAAIAAMLANRLRTAGNQANADAAWSNAQRAIVNIALRQYQQWQPEGHVGRSELLAFSDRGLSFIYDVAFGGPGHKTIGRLVLVYSFSKYQPPSTRDNRYHAASPAREGLQKGHAIGHAGGGFEGGPNYFPQAAELNQRRHAWPYGTLWRSIEEYLAANPDKFAFVRPLYRGQADTDEPSHVEFGLIDPSSQTRVTEFPNTALHAGSSP
ncbi:MAG: hypothetical protein NVSMB18_28280 [Acetobacteraceae bacterium]